MKMLRNFCPRLWQTLSYVDFFSVKLYSFLKFEKFVSLFQFSDLTVLLSLTIDVLAEGFCKLSKVKTCTESFSLVLDRAQMRSPSDRARRRSREVEYRSNIAQPTRKKIKDF